MTTTAASAHRTSTLPAASYAFSPRARLPMRSFEIAALRRDGSIYIGQQKAPAIHLFESAFAAFARGTPIATPCGAVSIEDLQPGDTILTSDGSLARLMWIGSSSFVPADAGRRIPLIRITPDSFGHDRPDSFLTFGPAARLLHTPHDLRSANGEHRMLTPLRNFLDGVNVIEVAPPTPVRLFHLCLDRHAAISAGGIEVESFHPGTATMQRVSSSLRQRFLALFPHVTEAKDFGPQAFPRAPDMAEPSEMV